MTTGKNQTLFDLGIDEEVIKQQPTDYILIKNWLSEFFKNFRDKFCSKKDNNNNNDYAKRYKTGEEKP